MNGHRARPRFRPRAGRASGGFSLIEVIFALGFLGFGLLAVARLVPLATHQVVDSKKVTDAVAAGQAKMEELRGASWTAAVLAAGDHSDVSGKYTRDWTVQDNTPVAGSKRIDITVTWTDRAGTEQTRMATFVTR